MRETYDVGELWRDWMLAGYYGVWRNGKEITESWRNRDSLHSFPDGASLTKYGIDMMAMKSGYGEWHYGGKLAQASLNGKSLELFGKLWVPIRHGGIKIEQDEIFDLFLVTRSAAGSHGRVVRQWRFNPNEMLLTGDVFDHRILNRSTRNPVQRAAILQPSGSYRSHLLDAYLDVDREKKLATVSVTGLKRPFSETVDLASLGGNEK